MCGIIGAVAKRDITSILVEGLKRLEYRGYDSAGVAIIDATQKMQRRRIRGKVVDLSQLLEKEPLHGNTGIAHTRWATHGVPADYNAHPHFSNDEVAVVHNGIIENHEELREKLIKLNYEFFSDTDTEVIAHLLHHHYQQTKDLLQALFQTINELHGAYALGIIHQAEPHRLVAVRCGSPLVIGLGINENFITSDSLALLPVTNRFIYLEEGDIADISEDSYTIYNNKKEKIERKIYTSNAQIDVVEKGQYRHYMQKEIFEQPQAINATLEGRITNKQVLENSFGHKAHEIFKNTQHVTIIACGTSYHAGLVARFWLEEIAKIPCNVEIASEYRYRSAVVQANTLFVTISQSGETADTLAALRLAKEQHYIATLAICNVAESSLVRESDLVFMTRAGREIGVASTKAFTTQLTALLLLTLVLARHHGLTAAEEQNYIKQLKSLPSLVEQSLQCDEAIRKLAKSFADKEHTLFLGRGCQYPIALEGALKLKEISYIHAEAYPAGELKHGPLALVDEQMPVITVAPNDHLLEKLKSNLQEVHARGGRLIVFADETAKLSRHDGEEIIIMPTVPHLLTPIIYTIPLQLLAYHVAVIKGTDVDQPRNLAKSVTVE